MNPVDNRVRLTKLMFERFGVEKCYLANQALMTLYAVGSTAGMVVGMGHGVSFAQPIYEGMIFKNAFKRTNVAGRALDNFIKTRLSDITTLEDAQRLKSGCEAEDYVFRVPATSNFQ